MYQITLRAARTNRGLTLDEVARLVDRTPKTIAKYESDSTSIPRDLFLSLVKLYTVPEDMVFCGVESVFIGYSKGNTKRKRKVS
ncbi:helix-turn-helix transcriptional regulator [Mycolicibacterium fortuitum]|uniref:helix-turn-helix domain-containing protein n=1 Tax=Paenibacillus sp. FSL W8-1287 TaxID=2954653 RepID=UPI001CE1548E|nr:helix-turn-helix transcriptional regulator [Mycolicibacterium fortuitum]